MITKLKNIVAKLKSGFATPLTTFQSEGVTALATRSDIFPGTATAVSKALQAKFPKAVYISQLSISAALILFSVPSPSYTPALGTIASLLAVICTLLNFAQAVTIGVLAIAASGAVRIPIPIDTRAFVIPNFIRNATKGWAWTLSTLLYAIVYGLVFIHLAFKGDIFGSVLLLLSAGAVVYAYKMLNSHTLRILERIGHDVLTGILDTPFQTVKAKVLGTHPTCANKTTRDQIGIEENENVTIVSSSGNVLVRPITKCPRNFSSDVSNGVIYLHPVEVIMLGIPSIGPEGVDIKVRKA